MKVRKERKEMSLDTLLKVNTIKAHEYPNVINEEKLCRDYWQGYITYEQYINKLKELRKVKRGN